MARPSKTVTAAQYSCTKCYCSDTFATIIDGKCPNCGTGSEAFQYIPADTPANILDLSDTPTAYCEPEDPVEYEPLRYQENHNIAVGRTALDAITEIGAGVGITSKMKKANAFRYTCNNCHSSGKLTTVPNDAKCPDCGAGSEAVWYTAIEVDHNPADPAIPEQTSDQKVELSEAALDIIAEITHDWAGKSKSKKAKDNKNGNCESIWDD